ncbi:MAG: glutathionylspermidine synthase family protein [Lachnospiraceae bacterium]|nr:glutathionylspermidine synthase family protein [Lachnospiraceae bacterium]
MSYETQILEIIERNRTQAAADFQKINQLIKENDLSYKNICVRTLAVPKILSESRYAEICAFITKLFAIFDKVINHYFADQDYRELFGFSPELNELILASKPRNGWIPMARIDFFLNEETGAIKMCEINTDGTSAMNEDRLLSKFLSENTAFQSFAKGKTYWHFELFDSWVKEFLTVCQTFCDEKTPRVAIVDFLDVGYVTEFEKFKDAFIRHGIETEICDIRDLSYDGKVLRSKNGMVIDAVYRRAVTSDIMNKLNEAGAFIKAAKDNAVCLVGDFVTQIIHNKRLFFILFDEATKRILSEQEFGFIKEHFPATFLLTRENLTAHKVMENREEWIIKPCDSYGAKGFYAGRNLTQEKWEQALREHLKDDYVLQKFHAPYKTPNIDFSNGINSKIREYSNLTGIFCYNGKPYGAYSRMADGEIISTQYDEKTIATIIMEER